MIDAFGNALRDYLNGDQEPYVIRRDDGFVERVHDLRLYFSHYSEWQDLEKEILKYARGRILDIGAGAGRHALYFQDRDFEVHAIDISPGAVEVMKQTGLSDVYLMDLRRVNFPDDYFDSILMMFNNFGLAGTVSGTKKLLRVFYRISTRQGRIIATIRDPYQTENPAHLAYQERNKNIGKMAGEIKIRIEYKNKVGGWFKLLIVSPGELEELIKDTGWGILKIINKDDGNYGAVLEKK